MHLNRKKIKHTRLKISARGSKKKKTATGKNVIKYIEKFKKRNKKLRITSRGRSTKENGNEDTYLPLSKWKNILEGHTAFILGNAPGVEKQDLSLLDSYFTIGINRIFYIYDPTILMWQDKQVWTCDKKTILRQKAIKVCGSKAGPRNKFLNFRVKIRPFKFAGDLEVLYGTGNTTVLSAQFAVALGCSNIVLLGTDCAYGHKGKTDFYGKNKDHKPYTLKMCHGAMQWLKDSCPVKIYNCSGNKLWKTQKLEKVINEIQPLKLNRKAYRKIFSK